MKLSLNSLIIPVNLLDSRKTVLFPLIVCLLLLTALLLLGCPADNLKVVSAETTDAMNTNQPPVVIHVVFNKEVDASAIKPTVNVILGGAPAGGGDLNAAFTFTMDPDNKGFTLKSSKEVHQITGTIVGRNDQVYTLRFVGTGSDALRAKDGHSLESCDQSGKLGDCVKTFILPG